MISLLFLLNVLVLFGIEVLLVFMIVSGRRWLWGGLLAAFNVVLVIQLAPLIAPGFVLQFLDGPNIAERERSMLAQLGQPERDDRLIVSWTDLGSRYGGWEAVVSSFLTPPCGDQCLAFMRDSHLTELMIYYPGSCPTMFVCEQPVPEQGTRAISFFLRVQAPARSCADGWSRRETPGGPICYRIHAGTDSSMHDESGCTTTHADWLLGRLALGYCLSYIAPEHRPLSFYAWIQPEGLLLFPTLGEFNPFVPSRYVRLVDYVPGYYSPGGDAGSEAIEH